MRFLTVLYQFKFDRAYSVQKHARSKCVHIPHTYFVRVSALHTAYLELVLSALLLPCAFILTSCNQTAFTKQINKADKSANLIKSQIAPSTPEEAKRISIDDAKAAYDKGGVVMVDTRDADSFAPRTYQGSTQYPAPRI